MYHTNNNNKRRKQSTETITRHCKLLTPWVWILI